MTFRGEMGGIKKERCGKLMSERRGLDVEVRVMWERYWRLCGRLGG